MSAIPTWAIQFKKEILDELKTIITPLIERLQKNETVVDKHETKIIEIDRKVDLHCEGAKAIDETVKDLNLIVNGDSNGNKGLIRKQDEHARQLKFILGIFSFFLTLLTGALGLIVNEGLKMITRLIPLLEQAKEIGLLH